MTKAEEILEKHLAIMDAETMIGKHGRTHKAVINAINEAINYTHSCKSGSEQLVCDDNELDCPYEFTSRCTMGRCGCKPKAS